MTKTVDHDRLAKVTTLYKGAHTPDGMMCVMEAVAFVAREPWSDHPECACPVLTAFMQSWNDNLSDEDRTLLLLPIVPRLVGTRGSKKLEARRATMAADWFVRVFTPAWLRLAGLSNHADVLAAFPEIVSFEKTPSIEPTLRAAQEAATAAAGSAAPESAAESAAWSAAESAAWSAAGSAAGSAAWSAAWSAAESAAWSAAEYAAWSAAGPPPSPPPGPPPSRRLVRRRVRRLVRRQVRRRVRRLVRRQVRRLVRRLVRRRVRRLSAVWSALNTTRLELQQSALLLIQRMIDAKDTAK